MKNIVLIGMPGVGKSTLGVVLAKTIGKPFIDTDIIIQQNKGKILQDIINDVGIDNFIKLEGDTILNLNINNHVIATGGSVVYCEKAMKKLKDNGIVIYLELTLQQIKERLDNIKTRGVIMKEGQDINDLYNERIGLYEKYQDITIDCNNNTLEQNVKAIIDMLNLNY